MDVIRNNEFLDLPPEEVATLLAMDDLNIPSEEVIFYVSRQRKHLLETTHLDITGISSVNCAA